MVAINRLQSEKLGDVEDSASWPATKAPSVGTSDAIAHAAKHGHKLLFPAFDGSEDPLPEAGNVFLSTFYMFGEVLQWYTLL
jgi:hypothetical protein